MMNKLHMKGRGHRIAVLIMLLTSTVVLWAQQTIQLKSAGQPQSPDKAVCVKSDMKSLKATFSFSTIEAQDYKSKEGDFSALSLANTVIGGNEGDPQIPVINELISVPVGSKPRIEIKSCRTEDYKLNEFGIKTLVPRQPSLRKDQKAEDVPFVYNKAAYQKSGLDDLPKAVVEVVGTMRGVRLGKMTIEPVSYDPVNNTLRVFNDIEVEVFFDGANAKATKDLYTETYSPYFDIVYKQLFNGSAAKDAYTDHPDLYTTPVKMLVITTSTYAGCQAFQNWLTWKKQKGIDVDVQTINDNMSSTDIRSLIQSRYNANHPTFLVIVGNKQAVQNYTTYTVSGLNYNPYVSDNQYASIDDDVYHDMFMSRMSVSTTGELSNLVNKILTYEKYTMPDPSYLNEALLIAGWDSNWAPKVGYPTIQYANHNYFNTAHGINPHVYLTTGSQQTSCYNDINNVGFVNYTAHGDIQELADPSFTNNNANAMTNANKYLWVVANCCLTANWGHDTYKPCLGETMIRAANKGAFGYIGSIPESYWYEDYYFGVGAFPYEPSVEQNTSSTTMGIYDAMFDDTGFNTLNSVPYIGNVAVTKAHASNYTSSVSDEYYWRAYQCLGDGSVMPYLKVPAANNVSHASTILIGANTFSVNADAGSYVSITKDNEIIGVAQVPANGMVEVPIPTPITNPGDVMIVVTRNQRQPYIQTITAIAPEGPYITLDGFTPTIAHIGENSLSISLKNVGIEATTGTTTVTLSSNDENVTIIEGHDSNTFDVLGTGEDNNTVTIDDFMYSIADGVADGTHVTLHYTAVNGENIWEGNFVITVEAPVLEFNGMNWDGSFVPGQTLTVGAKFKNTGNYPASNAVVTASSTSNYVTIGEPTINIEAIGVGEEVTVNYTITIASECPETAQLPITFTMTADGGTSTQGIATLKNTCFVTFNLADSYGDGWNGAKLIVSFDDGNPSQELTIASDFSAVYSLEIGNGTHVTLTWQGGNYDGECSFSVCYEGELVLYEQAERPVNGVLYEFDCNCAAASQIFNVIVNSSNTAQGTVSGSGEYSFGQSCTVTATPVEGYYFTGWICNGNMVSGSSEYTFNVTSDINLVANFALGTMIGDGATATSNYLPTYSYYNYAISQQIYTVEELGTPGFITSFALYNVGPEKTRTLDIYLKSTTKSSFASATDWETVSADDRVFSGDVTFASDGWTFITLSTPFLYDCSSNVVLVIDDNSGDYTSSPHLAFHVFDADAPSQAIYAYSDGTNYNPSAPGSNGTVLSVKNQLLITKESLGDCVRPTLLSVTETGPDFVKLSWTENGASDEWIVVCGERTVTANTNEDFVLDGLDPETSYTIQVCPVCDENLTSKPITVTTLVACPIPQNVEVAKISSTAATLTWSDYNDSYNVQIGQPTFLITENFDNGIPSDWENDKTYPWTAADGYILSGNAGVSSSTSSVSVTVDYPAAGTISFDFWARGEGNDTNDWDNCRFYIDDDMKFRYGKHTEWETYSTTVTAGSHTFKWEYKKDNSVNPDGDCFMIDNIEMKSGEIEWGEPITVEDAEYTFTDLEPVTTYCVKVQGVCDTPTDWSDNFIFTTADVLELANNSDNSEAISEAAASNKLYDVTLTDRYLYKDGDWNTLCLPFEVTIAGSVLDGEGVEAKTLTGASIKGSKLHLAFGNAVTTLEAGVPYIIRWANDTENPTIFAPTFESVIVSNAANDYDAGTGDQRIRFIGTKGLVNFEPNDMSILFLGAGNTLYFPLEGAYVGAQRAYFKIGEDGKNAREIKGFSIDFGEVQGVTTGILTISDSRQNTEAGPWYTLDGRKLDTMPTTKGVYISNGRKVILR